MCPPPQSFTVSLSLFYLCLYMPLHICAWGQKGVWDAPGTGVRSSCKLSELSIRIQTAVLWRSSMCFQPLHNLISSYIHGTSAVCISQCSLSKELEFSFSEFTDAFIHFDNFRYILVLSKEIVTQIIDHICSPISFLDPQGNWGRKNKKLQEALGLNILREVAAERMGDLIYLSFIHPREHSYKIPVLRLGDGF